MEQFTKWSMGHVTDIVAALSKSRGGEDRRGVERREEGGEETRGGERGGGVRRGDEMVIGPSWLSLKANNHRHNHTTHSDKVCVGQCSRVCVRHIIHYPFINYSFCCIIKRVWNGFFVLSTCLCLCVCVWVCVCVGCAHDCVHIYLQLSITSHTFLFTAYSVCEVK